MFFTSNTWTILRPEIEERILAGTEGTAAGTRPVS
jgi:hypothetical protein